MKKNTKSKKSTSNTKPVLQRPMAVLILIAVFLTGAISMYPFIKAGAAVTVNPPTSLRASVTSPTTVSLNWLPSTSTPSPWYNIFRNNVQIGTMGVWISLDGSVTYTDSNLTPATTYTYYLQAENSNGVSASTNSVTVTTPAAPTANQLGTVKGIVTNKKKQPVANATVSVVYYSQSHKVVTGADGSYTLTGIPAGNYTISFTSPGYVSTSSKVSIGGGATSTLNVTLRNGR